MSELLEELGRIAREDSPPPLAESDLDAMIVAALEAEEPVEKAPAPKARTRRWWAAAAAVALLALGGGYLLGERSVERPEEPPLEARLPSGDVLTASPGARFEVLEPGPIVRRLELREGRVLFDVEPLGGEGRFVVETPDGVVQVRGTVFSVEAGEETTVRVYEGRVEVERAGAMASVGPNEMWRAGAPVAWEPGPLAAEAARAVAARAARPRLASAEPAIGRGASESASESGSASASEAELESEAAPEAEPALGPRPPALGSQRSESAAAGGPRYSLATRAQVRRWLADGDYQRARAVAARRGWTLIEADALRALGRHAEAAERYDRVARRGDGTAAYEAARLRFQRLDDPSGALVSLRSAEAPAALAERSLGLEARLLLRLGQPADARAVAERYLDRYPSGGLASWMAQLRDGAE